MSKFKFNIHNVMKVADLDPESVSAGLVKLIKEEGLVYEDHKLREHLYDVNDIFEKLDSQYIENVSDEVIEELQSLVKLLGKKDCAYIRLVFA